MNILIGKSGTGIGKSGTGINVVGGCMALLLSVLLAGPAAAGQTPHLLVSEHQGVISISLHDGSRIVAGQALRADVAHGFQRIALNEVGKTNASGYGGLANHGSGSGEAGQGDCDGSQPAYHGSGSGGAGQDSDDCDSDEDQKTDTHGSGSGNSSFGGGGCPRSHSSGSGGSGQSVGGCSGGAWGFVEIANDGDHLSLIVYRFGRFGAREYLLASGQRDNHDDDTTPIKPLAGIELWVAEP